MIEILLALGLMAIFLPSIFTLALFPLGRYAPSLIRMVRKTAGWLVIGPYQRRGLGFALFVWLPFLVTAVLFARLLFTGEGMSIVPIIFLIVTILGFTLWRAIQRARLQRYMLPGRERRRRR